MRSRRRVVSLLAAGLAFMLLATACNGAAEEPALEEPPGAPAEEEPVEQEIQPLRIALLLPGRKNDNSFNESAARSLEAVAQEDGNIEFTIIEELEADPTEVEPALRQFATEGYDLVIGHSITFVEAVNTVAPDFPDVAFMSAAAAGVGFEPTDNINDWTYGFPDMGYVLGVAAGMASAANNLGIVGGPDLEFIRIMHAAFRAGAESMNPDAEFQELFAGSFEDTAAAAEAAQSLIDRGADVLYCSGDGVCQGVAGVTERAGVPLVSGFGDLRDVAPTTALTATVLDIAPVYREFVEMVRRGEWGNQAFLSTLANDQVVVTEVNEAVEIPSGTSVEEIQAKVNEVLEQIRTGELDISGV